MRAPGTVAAGPLAAMTFAAALVGAAVLLETGLPNAYSVAALGAIAVVAAVFGGPGAALAASIAPALFADHFFIPPYDQVNFAARDMAVLVGIPLAAVSVSVCVRAAVLLVAFVRRHRTSTATSFDRWLVELSEPAHPNAERRSIG